MIVEFDREVEGCVCVNGIAGRVAGAGDRVDLLAVSQPGQHIDPRAIGVDRRLTVDAVDLHDHRVAGVGGSGQRGRAAVEVGGVEIKLAVASLAQRGVGDRAFGDRQFDGKVEGRADHDVAGNVAGDGNRVDLFAVGEPGQRVGPTAVRGDGRQANDRDVIVDAHAHGVAGVGSSGQYRRAAVEIGGVDIELAIAALGHRSVSNRALGNGRSDGEVQRFVCVNNVAGRVAGDGDRVDVLAVGQAAQRVRPCAIGPDRRLTSDAVDLHDHRVAGIGGSGQCSRAVVEVGGIEIELAVVSRGQRSVGDRAFGNGQFDGEIEDWGGHDVAGGVAGGGDSLHGLAVGQACHGIGPGAVGADRRITTEAVDAHAHGVAGVGDSG